MEKTQLQKLFESVKEEHLTKSDLEKLHSDLTMLFASMHLEMASCEKKEALYFEGNKIEGVGGSEKPRTDTAIKRMWNVTEDGQRLITLKHSAKACEKVLSSLKNRMYAMY